MYSRTRRSTAPLSRRQKRVFAVVGALLIAVFAGASVWALSHPGSYGRSHAGCVNVNLPSSTGGGIAHECGAAARAMCQSVSGRHDEAAVLTQRQCRLAGIDATPGATAVPAASPAPTHH
jgi:hypothetical protein